MKKRFTKERVLYGIIIVLILWLIGSDWMNKRRQQSLLDEMQEQNKMIVQLDETTKEKDGQYAKLVNYFESDKSLMNELKEGNKELAKQIKKSDERILMLTSTVISLREEISQGNLVQDPDDSTVFDMALRYPNSEDPFIKWDGSIFTSTQTYKGKWSFGSLPLQVVLTETERGLWKSRLIGPEWLLVDSIEVNSLPPEDFSNKPEPSKWGIYLGGGYIKSFDQNMGDGLSIGTGINFKNHSLIINGGTNSTIGFNYYYKFSRFKRK